MVTLASREGRVSCLLGRSLPTWPKWNVLATVRRERIHSTTRIIGAIRVNLQSEESGLPLLRRSSNFTPNTETGLFILASVERSPRHVSSLGHWFMAIFLPLLVIVSCCVYLDMTIEFCIIPLFDE
jgi:hypothetical protein